MPTPNNLESTNESKALSYAVHYHYDLLPRKYTTSLGSTYESTPSESERGYTPTERLL